MRAILILRFSNSLPIFIVFHINIFKIRGFNFFFFRSNDEPEVIAFNRNALPIYYGLLRLACQYSAEFCQQLANHRNMTWAFKHLTPRINQYPQVFPLPSAFAPVI